MTRGQQERGQCLGRWLREWGSEVGDALSILNS